MIELIAGKAGVLEGKLKYGTAFGEHSGLTPALPLALPLALALTPTPPALALALALTPEPNS